MKHPCKSCTEKAGKAKDYCTGCEAWRDWFREAWRRVCRRIKNRGKGEWR